MVSVGAADSFVTVAARRRDFGAESAKSEDGGGEGGREKIGFVW